MSKNDDWWRKELELDTESKKLSKKQKKIKVKDMLYNPTRIGFLQTLKKMGANIEIKNKRIVHNEIIADVYVNQKKELKLQLVHYLKIILTLR